ncbi:MAG: EF-P lysine aminoacylase GenX [Planctomycetaceae bacterium]|jgi:lysyl-tRNA synthetase class 2|nr:EF-P lysine aminoacylase GenX [Planctomycetaceae bacterium]
MSGFLPTLSFSSVMCRSHLLRAIRVFFEGRGFVEVQTPVLSADTVVDRFVEPIFVNDESLPLTYRNDRNYYLQTSPEFAMKRLLSAGFDAIFQICPAFRRWDRGVLHNIEFTMLEWYRVGDDYYSGMRFLWELVSSVLGNSLFQHLERNFSEISFVKFDEIFTKYVGKNYRGLSIEKFRVIADERGIGYPESFLGEGNELLWIDLLFSELVQPELRAAIVYDYPEGQSQLAKCRTNDEGVVVSERFELFLGGVEVANGYNELTDAKELRERLSRVSAARVLDGAAVLPVESRLLRAMEYGLPESSGTALGVDRLLLYILGAKSIDDVIAFPIEYC